jgi:hypothetical protein
LQIERKSMSPAHRGEAETIARAVTSEIDVGKRVIAGVAPTCYVDRTSCHAEANRIAQENRH